MSTDTQKYSNEHEKEAPHSAFEEFSRDERRPAVLLLAGLIIAAVFFALGILFGRWTDKQPGPPPGTTTNQQGQSAPNNKQPSPSPSVSPSATRQNARPSPRR